MSNDSSCIETPIGHFGGSLENRLAAEAFDLDASSLGFDSALDSTDNLSTDDQLEDDSDEDLEGEGWLNNDTFAVAASMLGHMAIVLLLALVPLAAERPPESIVLLASPPDYEEEVLQEIEEIVYSEIPQADVGANSLADAAIAEASAPEFAEIAEIPNPIDQLPQQLATVNMNNIFSEPVAPMNLDIAVKGTVGQATEGASGAVDRLTFEIVKSLEDRPTLVVWLFDQSGSLTRQRAEIRDRFDRIYDQLGLLEKSGDDAFASADGGPPLLTSIMAFGQSTHLLTEEPLADLAEIKSVVDQIENDPSGLEYVFSAVHKAATKYKDLRRNRNGTGPERNVMLVVITDERGTDIVGMEPTIAICQRYAMPVYVIGVPAPFGQEQTMIKYVDPDPEFDQTPQFAAVDQGPESFYLESVTIDVLGNSEPSPVIDSGFGPFALTRLTYETGGIFFTVHPNRNVNRRVSRGELSPFASDIDYFVDSSVMNRYRPDYIAPKDYEARVRKSPLRTALTNAARLGRVDTLANPRTRFVKRDEAQLSNELARAQQPAALVEAKLNQVDMVLRSGEAGRKNEDSPRWLAGFDLARGRVLAHKVRAEAYNATLAKARQGMPFADPKNNTWVLKADAEISVGSKLQREGEDARALLQAVVSNHPGTPWALLAEQELKIPVGWKWTETFTEPDPPRPPGGGNNNNAPPPQDDQLRMLDRKPVRAVPKL